MPEIIHTIKLRLYTDQQQNASLQALSTKYAEACNFVSQYIFTHKFPLQNNQLQAILYRDLRSRFGLKSQMAISSIKTTTARYKTVREQMAQKPYRYTGEDGKTHYIERSLEWMQKPVHFSRPQADLVRGRDYSFIKNRTLLSIRTLQKRIRIRFAITPYFSKYFDGTWKFGTGKIVKLKGIWYLHIPARKTTELELDRTAPKHIVGIDRGLRFIAVTYDEVGKTNFLDGKPILRKREKFQLLREKLQSKGTKSAKRVLKRMSGRENRWMTDINHRISKTLVSKYGRGTLFVIEDLTGISFNEDILSLRNNQQRRQISSWSFYELEKFLAYKANAVGSSVVKVASDYTSQRCPKCGRIQKSNRKRHTHEYICDCCGYRSNDDRIGAMNVFSLGTMYVAGDSSPKFGCRHGN